MAVTSVLMTEVKPMQLLFDGTLDVPLNIICAADRQVLMCLATVIKMNFSERDAAGKGQRSRMGTLRRYTTPTWSRAESSTYVNFHQSAI